jgi:hypothetical protein
MSNQDVQVSEVQMTEMNTKIKYSFEERREGITKQCFAHVKFDFQPSEDLRECVKALRPHVAVLMNYSNEDDIADLKEAKENSAIVTTGIKFFEKPNSNSVQITGFIHSKGKQIPFATPKIDLMDSQYKFLDELAEITDDLLDEAAAFVNGKFDKARTQLSIMDDVREVVGSNGEEEEEVELQEAA